MQKTSSLYKRLLADPGHWKEHSLVIGENGVLITKQGDRITFGSKSYTAEAKGSVIQLENVPEAPLRGLTIYGKTTQNGTPSPDNPVPLVSPGESGVLNVYVGDQTLPISTPNGLPGIPVTSGGNYTDENGQQWICDEVDFDRGVYVKMTELVDMENLSWYYYGTYWASSSIADKVVIDYRKPRLMAECYKVVGWSDKESGTIAMNGTGNIVITGDKEIGHTGKLLYALATPIEIPLSESELAAYAALRTDYPNTTIYNDGGADMVVGYALNGEGPTNILVGSSGADSGFRENSIISMSTQKSIFLDSNPTVGNCISGQIAIDMMKPRGNIPRRARISPYVRLSNGKESSEWIQKGVFFIDHREYSGNENERILINGYDHIILTEDEFPSSTNEWPRTDIDVVRDIANEISANVDERTIQIMNKGYKINYPSGYSMREVLENIAAMYAGSFIMSDIGELLLVTMFGIPKETSYLIDNSGFAVTFGGDRILV